MTQLATGAGPIPGQVSQNLFDRPGFALSRLAEGDVPGTFRALLKPSTLSPAELTTLADKWGLAKDDWRGPILRTVTSPIVLVGLILSLRYPVPLARELFKFAPSLTGLARGSRSAGLLGTLRRFTGGIDETFAGLKAGTRGGRSIDLPEAYKTLMRDVDGFRQVNLEKMAFSIQKWERATGRAFDEKMEILLAGHLDGPTSKLLKPITEGNFVRLRNESRGILESMWDQVFGKVNEQTLRRALKHHGTDKKSFKALLARRDQAKKLGDAKSAKAVSVDIKKIQDTQSHFKEEVREQLRNSGIDASSIVDAKRTDNFFAHRVSRKVRELEQSQQDIVALTSERAEAGRMLAGAGRTVHGIQRRGRMLVDPEDLKVIRDQMKDPRRIKEFEAQIAKGKVRPYSLKYNDVMASYTHSVGRAWGWTVSENQSGAMIVNAVRSLKASGTSHNKVRAAMLENTYVPVALGRQTMKQFTANASWDAAKESISLNIKSGALSKILPKGVKDFLKESLATDKGLFTFRNVQGKIASHFYLGALGGNPVSSAWNIMQTMLTTVPVIGAKFTAGGMGRALKSAPRYFEARRQGLSHIPALEKAFPLFKKTGLSGNPITDDVLRAMDTAWDTAGKIPPNASGKYDKVKGAMMSLFTASENFVRLSAFEGTMAKAAAEGLEQAAAIRIAGRVVETTQFLSGPSNLPFLFANSGPLLRQFGTFPLRFANFLIGPATELGSAAQRGGLFGLFPDRNFGTLGRALLTSGLAYEGARNFFDQDISQGLLFGALPSRPKGSVLEELPFIPPIVSLALAATKGATTGDFDELVRQIPILVPGGVQMARMSTAYAPGVAEAIGRSFADYDQQLQDGRIPIYTSNGNFKEFVTPLQLHMQALGLPPGGPGSIQKERELQQFLLGNRDRIREFRRQFVEAIDRNDVRSAEGINKAYQKAYPGFGKIQIKPTDIKAIRLRKMIPRLERVLETIPAELRPLFGEVITKVLAEQAEQLLGVDPALLQIPGFTIRQREVYRDLPPGGVIEQLHQQAIRRRQVLGVGRRSGRATQGRSRTLTREAFSPRTSSALDLTPF